jgi:hypothetical protein
MTAQVTVMTGPGSVVLVPFSSATNAALAQTALDAAANAAASGGFLAYFSPDNVSGPVALPPVPFFGGVVDTVPAALNFGILDPKYTSLVNAGSGLVAAIGGPDTTLVSGANASTIYINQSTRGEAYIGGGNVVLSNAFSTSHLDAFIDQAPGGALGGSTLILDNSAGGGINATVGGGVLVQLEGEGTDSVLAQGGTVAILGPHNSGIGGFVGASTIAATAGTDLWIGAPENTIGNALFITPGAGNAFVFPGVTGDTAVTLFGGTHVINGQTIAADAYTGRTTVLGVNGYLQAGSAGGSIMQSGTLAGVTTLVAGGAGDILLLQATHNTVVLGDAENVIASGGVVSADSGGDTFYFGSGSGTVSGSGAGENTFVFQGAGRYTVAGFHASVDLSLKGSIYMDDAGAGGAGDITILDFLPAMAVGSSTVQTVFDRFELHEGVSVSSMTTADLGNGFFDSVATLSDGTTVTFKNTLGVPHYDGVSTIS